MPAKYIIRFDDICPTMNWETWKKIERILIKKEIAPILAVVPDNKDKELMFEDAHAEFWDSVRSWQSRGWTIGIHGYQHTYVTDRAGLIGLNHRSEFAGLSEQEQEAKLKTAIAIFQREEIAPEVWVAPGHSFDAITLRVLKRFGLNVVSDGLYLSPNIDANGVTYVPQQLWRFRPMPLGLWTVCYHHNDWSDGDVDRFASDVERYKQQVTSLRIVLKKLHHARNRNVSDAVFARVWLWFLQTRSSMRKSIARN